ncbi:MULTISPECIES: hypothetical protein [unclassified Mesorhizobium]|uniref:hypothetical protein n=1 Tax=unclassified Mesorhizobium TaxID=325217 RepID=UPI0011273B82|nr:MULTISPECIES: hypothetical protein [unclassified Mesorhizobium]MCA0000927.1 hypothetical protein [Mesorhizobium sp. B264B2A]MCA0004676.1 hypothetical protein [Mesorhizobium sp. B264B1B]MCA0019125.1 hypothetical protein [Mesorhizobium sp. B264B1A]TPJ38157.1 hypothetical protein FJ437_30730 [Mesorhizobium sp. B2-6-6]
MPTLEECSDVYAVLKTKKAEINSGMSAAVAERRGLEKAIAADTSREVRPAIAELLGDAPSGKALSRKRVAELKQLEGDLEAAQRIVDQRISDAHTEASRAACAAVRPEFANRVVAMVEAMKVLDAAHQSFEDLCRDLEAEDIRYGTLGQMKPFFLGDAKDGSGRIANYLKEAREAGYAI